MSKDTYYDQIEISKDQFLFVINKSINAKENNFITVVNGQQNMDEILQEAGINFVQYSVQNNKNNPVKKDLIIQSVNGKTSVEDITPEKLNDILDNIPKKSVLLIQKMDVIPDFIQEAMTKKLYNDSPLKNVIFEYRADKNVPMILQVRSIVLKLDQELVNENKVKVKM